MWCFSPEKPSQSGSSERNPTSVIEENAIRSAKRKGLFPTTESEAARIINQNATNADRIRHLYNGMKEIMRLPEETDLFIEKNELKAKSARAKFNLSSHYMKVLCAHNESLCLAPVGSRAMAKAYAERGSLYAMVGFYQFALDDFDKAWEYRDQLREDDLDTLSGRKNEVLLKKAEIESRGEEDAHLLYGNIREVELTWARHPIVPFIDSGLVFNEDAHYGRNIKAGRDFKPGEIISLEQPYLFVPYSRFRYSCCYHCGNHNFFHLIPCQKSTRVMFCSDKCMKEAQQRYYRFECPIVAGLQDWVSNGHYALRATLKAFTLFKTPVALKNFFASITEQRAFDCDLETADELTRLRCYYFLATNEDKRTSHLITVENLAKCAIIYHMVKEWTSLGLAFKEDTELESLFLDLLMRFLMIGQINNFEVTEPFRRSRHPAIHYSTNGMAQATYLVTSLFAHSCAPNIATFMANRTGKLGIVVLQPIKEGQQLFISYGTNFAIMEREKRQEWLKVRYHFDCKCMACEDPVNFDELEFQPRERIPENFRALLRKLKPSRCLFDDEAISAAFDVKDMAADYIAENYDERTASGTNYMYAGFILNALVISIFKKPLDVIFRQKQARICQIL